jgi:proteasome assembly chaperone (PAC2) family protein
MWEKIVVTDEPKMQDPVLLVALSTSLPQYRALYSQARELGRFMLKNMDFQKFATVYASALSPSVVISEDGTSRMVSDEFYSLKAKRDIILLVGDSSPLDEQYEFCTSVLKFARRLGVKEMISVGARWAEQAAPLSEEPKVLGFSTDADGVEALKALGVKIIADEPAPYFASLIVGMASRYGMRGYKIAVNHGEPAPHPRSLIQILSVLSKILNFEVETKELVEKAREAKSENESPVGMPPLPRERQGVYG